VKPLFEHVSFPSGCSIRVYDRQIPAIPFEWHHHPEYELTLTLNSRGWRFIGDHIGAYDSQDLVLVPSDMPHTWASTAAIDETQPHRAIVIWFTKVWALRLLEVCPEFFAVGKLLDRAAPGLHFTAPAGARMESHLVQLLADSPRERLLSTLELLTELADVEAAPLATHATTWPNASDESSQLTRVLAVLHTRFTETIRVEDLCAAGNLSPRTLHRLFVRHLGENVSDYLGRLRIGRACMLLAETNRPISLIAAEAGFSNLSNVNRRFLQIRRLTPKDFRRFVVKHGRMPGASVPADLTKRSPSLETRRHAASKRSVHASEVAERYQ
jgi:AraC-like DNA-binding protein